MEQILEPHVQLLSDDGYDFGTQGIQIVLLLCIIYLCSIS
jgi:hypothetical protein